MCECIYYLALIKFSSFSYVNCTVSVDSIHCIEYHNRSLSHSLVIFFAALLVIIPNDLNKQKKTQKNHTNKCKARQIKNASDGNSTKIGCILFFNEDTVYCTHTRNNTHTQNAQLQMMMMRFCTFLQTFLICFCCFGCQTWCCFVNLLNDGQQCVNSHFCC